MGKKFAVLSTFPDSYNRIIASDEGNEDVWYVAVPDAGNTAMANNLAKLMNQEQAENYTRSIP